MNSTKKVAETIQQSREWAKAEYEAKTKGLNFTKDFYTRQEALMRDPLATVGERVMGWILRRSWGEYRLYAVRDDGEPAYQVDCARTLKLDKKAVSRAIGYLQARGYLENQPKLLYPVISPHLTTPVNPREKSQEYATFYEDWKVAHSCDFQREEVARSTIKEINKVRLSLYKKWLKAQQNGEASLLENQRVNTESEEDPSSSAVVVFSPPPKAEEEETTSYQKFKAAYPAAHFNEAETKPIFEDKPKPEQLRILERLQVYLQCDRWTEDGGRWIKLASNWLKSYDADPPPALKKTPAKKSYADSVREEAQRRIAKFGRL